MPQSNRAGQYRIQPGGYNAFIPAPLPPGHPIDLTEPLLAAISRADLALGRLDGSVQTLPAPDLFVMMYVRKEAVLSSQIEGTQSSLDDVLEAEAQVLRPGRPRDVDEVVRYVEAMNYGLDRLRDLPVSLRLIREIHERLLSGGRGGTRQPGELRTVQNWIGPSGATLNEATFVPPPPQLVPQALAALETFLQRQDTMPILVKIGLAHAQFETIHPFLDGNGRVGRLLIVFLLCERRILKRPVLYISHYFRRYRQRYYDHLQAIRDEGDWEQWLHFFLSAVEMVAFEATETARKIVDLRERHRTGIVQHFGRRAANGLRVLESLFSRPVVTVNDVAKLTGVTFPSANALTNHMVDRGILHEITGQTRNRIFKYTDYIDLFADRPRER